MNAVNICKKIAPIAAIGLGSTSVALAQESSLGEVLTNVRTDTLGPAGDFIGAGAFILGVIFGVMAIIKLVQNHRNPHDPASRPTQAIVLGVAAAAMIAIPTFLGMGVTTLFGTGAETTSIDGQLRSLN
jgi:Na+/proline symporter